MDNREIDNRERERERERELILFVSLGFLLFSFYANAKIEVDEEKFNDDFFSYAYSTSGMISH